MINLLKGIIIAMFIAITGGLLIDSELTFCTYVSGFVTGVVGTLIAIAGTDIL